jgi:hypothetical protein
MKGAKDMEKDMEKDIEFVLGEITERGESTKRETAERGKSKSYVD